MPAKPGRKSKFTRADHERIRRMLADGYTDEQVASVFDVHRTTIGRLRAHLDGGEMPAAELSKLQAFIELSHREYSGDLEKRDADLVEWRRKYLGGEAVKDCARREKEYDAWKKANWSHCVIAVDGNGYCGKCTPCRSRWSPVNDAA
jgi:hypothetical protein